MELPGVIFVGLGVVIIAIVTASLALTDWMTELGMATFHKRDRARQRDWNAGGDVSAFESARVGARQ